jgi:hypothetical protein
MQMLHSKKVEFLDAATLNECQARETLFRNAAGFILYLSNGSGSAASEERVIRLGAREALLWLNERETDCSSFWE